MTFSETVSAAIKDFSEHGYHSEQQLEFWMAQIRLAAEHAATSRRQMEQMLQDALRAVYQRLVERQGVLKTQRGVDRFVLARLAPRLRAELDRRIMSSAQLIKLNREDMITKTLRRFSGWATSIPKGGSAEPALRATAADVKKAIKALPFLERRVLIDQGHKLVASINAVVAKGGGAIAGRWRSHWRQANYDYREDHKERDQRVYLIRNSWASDAGLVKPGKMGYTDDITQPGEEVYCRCFYEYIFHLRDLPDDMVTVKGREALQQVRA